MDLRTSLQLFIYLFLFFVSVMSDCPPTSPNDPTIVKDYVYIEKDNYDRNYSSYDEDRRPLGFDKATVYFESNIPNPCIRVKGAANRMFEVLIQTVPSSKICMKWARNGEHFCNYGKLSQCDTAPADTVFVELFCDNCEETDVNVWYRIKMTDKGASGAEIENWCSTEIQEYPEDLYTGTLPPGFTLVKTKDGSGNGSGILYINSTMFVMVLIVALFFV